jgi:hypothetical protein
MAISTESSVASEFRSSASQKIEDMEILRHHAQPAMQLVDVNQVIACGAKSPEASVRADPFGGKRHWSRFGIGRKSSGFPATRRSRFYK